MTGQRALTVIGHFKRHCIPIYRKHRYILIIYAEVQRSIAVRCSYVYVNIYYVPALCTYTYYGIPTLESSAFIYRLHEDTHT